MDSAHHSCDHIGAGIRPDLSLPLYPAPAALLDLGPKNVIYVNERRLVRGTFTDIEVGRRGGEQAHRGWEV